MNPLTGALKYLGSGAFNALLALTFFIVAARFTTPAFVGKIALVQLLETVTASALVLLPVQLVSRDIAEAKGKGAADKEVVGTALSLSLLTSPAFLFLALFPRYLWLTAPYLLLYLYSQYQGAVLAGRGMFTEANVGNVIYSAARWGISIIAVVRHSVYLFILIWTLGALARAAYQQAAIGPIELAFSRDKFLEMFRIGLPLYLSNVSNLFASQGDRITTAFLLGAYDLGIYQLMVLIASVPGMLISGITSAVLPAATYYRERGRSLAEMSSMTFRLMLVLSAAATIASVAAAPPVVLRLFPQYAPGIPSLELLLVALIMATPFTSLVNFVVVLRRGLKPLLLLSALNAVLVIATSLALIPKIGILGAAISQAAVQAVSAAYIAALAVKEGAFEPKRRDVLTVVSALPLILIPISWVTSLIAFLIAVKLLGVITEGDLRVIDGFTPSRLKFLVRVIGLLAGPER